MQPHKIAELVLSDVQNIRLFGSKVFWKTSCRRRGLKGDVAAVLGTKAYRGACCDVEQAREALQFFARPGVSESEPAGSSYPESAGSNLRGLALAGILLLDEPTAGDLTRRKCCPRICVQRRIYSPCPDRMDVIAGV